MIRIDLVIANPFKHKPWKSLYQGKWNISKNKTLEIGFFRYAFNIAEISLDLRWKGSDHAGPIVELGLFGWQIRIAIPDHRHWDSVNSRWHNYSNH